jgi:hypothetical protein
MNEISPRRHYLAAASHYKPAVMKVAILFLQVLVVGLAVIVAAQL